VIPLVLAGAVTGRAPNVSSRKAAEKLVLTPNTATMEDCCRILELLLGAKSAAGLPLSMGFVEIVSAVELNVIAVYTVSGQGESSPSIEMKTIRVSTV